MAIKPFRGLLFAQVPHPTLPGKRGGEKIAISRVVTEPYDKITPAMQDEYYRRDPHNFVRLILGKISASDNARDNRYVRAAATLDRWISQGVLRRDPEPAFYLYEQTFRLGGLGKKTRRGIIALMRLEDLRQGRVFPHERTLAKPRKDRLALLQATQANLEQIFLLYEDKNGTLEKRLDAASKTKPVFNFSDSSGARQKLWRIQGKADIDTICRFMDRRKLFIADGHHRYTISLGYHKQIMASTRDAAMRENSAWRMATLVSMHSPGLVILPTHRVIKMSPPWHERDEVLFLEKLRKDFVVDLFSRRGSLASRAQYLAQRIRRAPKSPQAPRFGYLSKTRMAVLTLRRSAPGNEDLRRMERPLRDLDVAVLHRLILERCLRVTPKSIERGGQIAYSRTPEEAAMKIASGEYAMGFLQNPPVLSQVKRIALAGLCMPQKSTDFYPKLLSGLVAYDMKERGAR